MLSDNKKPPDFVCVRIYFAIIAMDQSYKDRQPLTVLFYRRTSVAPRFGEISVENPGCNGMQHSGPSPDIDSWTDKSVKLAVRRI